MSLLYAKTKGRKMTEQETENILHTPFTKLTELCRDPVILVAVINTAYQQGTNLGQRRTHEEYNELFHKYTEVSITN